MDQFEKIGRTRTCLLVPTVHGLTCKVDDSRQWTISEFPKVCATTFKPVKSGGAGENDGEERDDN